MLSVFPIQFLALFAYFLLRLGTGLAMLYLGVTHYSERRGLLLSTRPPFRIPAVVAVSALIMFELVAAFFLIIGMWTQVAALAVAIFSAKMLLWHRRFAHPSVPSRLFYFLLLAVGLSLTITGAGVFAVDLPI